MSVDISTIKVLTKKLALIKLKKYDSLSQVKEDFDEIATEFIELNSDDQQVIEQLNYAANYFNLLTEEDFSSNDQKKINESLAIKSRFAKELNVVLVKYRKEIGLL